MGRLEFEELKIIVPSEEWAEVHGRYRLHRDGDYGNANGLFTWDKNLVLHYINYRQKEVYSNYRVIF